MKYPISLRSRTAKPPASRLVATLSLPRAPAKKAEKKPPPPPKPPPADVLARAESFQAMLAPAGPHTRASLPHHLGVSSAWVGQILAVLAVPTFLKDALRQAAAGGRPVGEGTWRRIRRLPPPEALRHLQERGHLPKDREHRELGSGNPGAAG